NRDELLAATMSEEEMRDYLGVTSLRFVSIDGLYRAVGEPEGRDPAAPRYYDAVFTGDYPIEPKDMIESGFQLKAAE
ncbi:MAG: amidophosphoribosyltransferase, partial [Pseudomonadota bacterium]